jgi:hypothetical protein
MHLPNCHTHLVPRLPPPLPLNPPCHPPYLVGWSIVLPCNGISLSPRQYSIRHLTLDCFKQLASPLRQRLLLLLAVPP